MWMVKQCKDTGRCSYLSFLVKLTLSKAKTLNVTIIFWFVFHVAIMYAHKGSLFLLVNELYLW